MSAFRPISPHAALQLLDAAEIGVDLERFLIDMAMAGVVRGYARLIETDVPGAQRREVRDSRIERDLWRRIVSYQKVGEIYASASVHLDDSDGQASAPITRVIGIRFDAGSVKAAAEAHGAQVAPTTAKPPKPANVPVKSPAAMPEPVAAEVPAVRRVIIEDGAVSISIDDAAAAIGVCRNTVYKMIEKGQVSAVKLGNRRLVSVESIRALIGP